MPVTELNPVFVEEIPKALEEGKIYISEKYHTSSHLCACGCGNLTVLPFGITSNAWAMVKHENGTISFTPSVGNHCFPCESHYLIKENKVINI